MNAWYLILLCLEATGSVYSIKDAFFKSCPGRKMDSIPFTKWNVKSKMQCAARCLADNSCHSANYKEDSNVCELFSGAVPDQNCDTFTSESGSKLLITTQAIHLKDSVDTTENTLVTMGLNSTIKTETVNPCKNNQQFNGSGCVCEPPLSGQFCEVGPRDCNGVKILRWYDIYPEDGAGKITVFCWEMWILLFSVPRKGLAQNMLNRNWHDFKSGFGNIGSTGEPVGGGYWLGNENIHRITNSMRSYTLQYEGDFPAYKAGNYFKFVLGDESSNYTLHYSIYSSSYTMREMLLRDIPFRTFDWNDNGCALQKETGFWYGQSCRMANVLLGTVPINNIEEAYDIFWASLVRA